MSEYYIKSHIYGTMENTCNYQVAYLNRNNSVISILIMVFKKSR